MHIPDNFLATPVWAVLDAVSAGGLILIARRAGREMEESRIPLLGVLGAFVFAAQMINFPVGIGTSGHLVGGALLAFTIGCAPAVVVMTAILVVQAFVFQDGGVLALGANVFNMAIAGVLAGYLPYKLWGSGAHRSMAVFLGAFLSLLTSAALALSELLISGIRMPRTMLIASIGLFVVSAVIEGLITVSVLGAIERLNARWVQRPEKGRDRTAVVLGAAAIGLATAGFLLASTAPDGLEHLGQQLGLAARSTFSAPLADYAAPFVESPWLRRASAGLAGLIGVYAVCSLAGRLIARRKNACAAYDATSAP